MNIEKINKLALGFSIVEMVSYLQELLWVLPKCVT